MITNIDIDIFKQPSDAIGHSCNCFKTMGGGIALRVKQNYPEAYKADCETLSGWKDKLGTISSAQSKKDGKHIYNMYCQFNFGRDKRHTNYEAVYSALNLVRHNLVSNGLKSISFPRNMCSTLGGADWRIIEKMIEVVFENSGIDVYICNYDPFKPSVDDDHLHWYGK